MSKKSNKKNIDVKAGRDGVKVKVKGGKAKTIKYKSRAFIVLAAVLALVAISFAVIWFAFPDVWDAMFSPNRVKGNPAGDLAVHFIDVGQGDCIIIQLPDGKNAIIDAGGNEANTTGTDCEQRILSNIWDLKITTFEYMILTHTDADHAGFMDTVLDECDVKNIYRPAFNCSDEQAKGINPNYATVDTNTYNDFVNAVEQEVREIGAAVYYNIGKKEIVGEGYRFDIYGVEEKYYLKSVIGNDFDAKEKNRVSPMVLLSYNSDNAVRRIMFTGDAEGTGGNRGEEIFMSTYNDRIDIDLLKVGHHGSESSAGTQFLQRLDPEYAVISVGVSNSYDHPNQKCLDRLFAYEDGKGQRGIEVYMTKTYGDIIFRVNKQGNMSFETDIKVAV